MNQRDGTADLAAKANQRKKLERLCRYISGPAVSEKRLSLTPNCNIRYQLKTPYRDGTTHVIFEPLDFIARLVAIVPKTGVNLTRSHGVFAPGSRYRVLVTPAKRGRGTKTRVADEPPSPAERRASVTGAQRFKRVFNIDIKTCSECGGAAKVIACIEDPAVIKQILDHLRQKAEISESSVLPESRTPPVGLAHGLFDRRAGTLPAASRMLRSGCRVRDSPCRMAGMEPIRKKEGEFSAHGTPCRPNSGVHRMVAERLNSTQKLLLDLGEKGVYSSYTQFRHTGRRAPSGARRRLHLLRIEGRGIDPGEHPTKVASTLSICCRFSLLYSLGQIGKRPCQVRIVDNMKPAYAALLSRLAVRSVFRIVGKRLDRFGRRELDEGNERTLQWLPFNRLDVSRAGEVLPAVFVHDVGDLRNVFRDPAIVVNLDIRN
jgi:hypothetical protein